MQNTAVIENILYLCSSGLVNQDLQKIWQEELTSLTARVSIQFILLQRQKMERFKISLIQSIYKMWQSFDDIDATSFGFQEFLTYLTRTTSQRFLHDTRKQGMGFTLCNHHKASKTNGLREYKSIIRIWEGQKRSRSTS